MRHLIALLTAAACTAPEPSWEAPPPPYELALAVPPLVVAKKVQVEIRGAEPFAAVHLVATAAGEGRGPCLRALRGRCLDLVRPQLVASGKANASGFAVLDVAVPALDEALPITLQAATTGSSSSRLSAPLLAVLQVSKRQDRGVWFWRDSSDPWGAAAVVGNSGLENAAIARLLCWGVRRVYASYDYDSPTWEADVEAWHLKLHSYGRTVDLLLAENTWIDSATWPNLQTKLQERLVDYEAGAVAGGHYDGVHLDIEPHALPGWSSASAADKRQDLNDLLATYQMVRTWLDANGHAATPLHVDIPVWFDNLPPALGGTGSVGWASVADRDQWFADVDATVSRVVLMAFDRTSVASVQTGVSWEVAALGGTARVALEADIGPGATWPNLGAYVNAMSGVEAGVGWGRPVDIQSFSLLAPLWGP